MRELTRKVIHERLENSNADSSFWIKTFKERDQGNQNCPYRALVQTLLGLKSESFEPLITQAGAPLLGPEQAITHPLHGLEHALLWQLIGHYQKNQKLIDAGIKAQNYIESLKDQWNRPFLGLFSSEKDVANFVFPSYLKTYINHCGLSPQCEAIDSDDRATGTALFSTPALSMAFTATGSRSGIGSIMREDVGIITMGPQDIPFNDPEKFGIDFSVNETSDPKEQKPLPGVQIARQGPLFHYTSWTKIERGEKHLWMNIDAAFEKTLHLNLQFLDLKGCQMAVNLFVKGDAVRIGEQKEIVSSSLKTYKGDIQNITLEGKQTQMVILPGFEGQMQIQPLAGDQSYWGADFLISYALDAGATKLSWTIY